MRISNYDGDNTARNRQRRWRGVSWGDLDRRERWTESNDAEESGKPDNLKVTLTEIVRAPTATLASQDIDLQTHSLPRVDSHRVTRELPPDNERPNCFDHVLRRLGPL